MTREPTEPLWSDESPPAASEGGPSPGAWEAGDDAVENWEADDGAAVAEAGSAPASGRKGEDEDDDPWSEIDLQVRREPWRLSHLMLAIVVVAVVLWLWITLGALGLVLTPAGLLAIAITAGFVLARLRASRQEALLSLLTIAAERGMPLAPAIAALADQFRGRAQRRILDIASALAGGQPLAEALGDPPGGERDPYKMVRIMAWGLLGERLFVDRRRAAVSRDALLMVRTGEECGLLAPALRLVAGARHARVNAWTAIVSRLSYLLMVMLIGESISGFLLYFIVPKFEAIFRDFGTPLPGITVFLIDASHFLVRHGVLSFAIYMMQVGLLLFLPFSFGGWMNYRLPIFDRLLARRHSALVLRALSVVIEANKPIGLGLQILAERYPARWVRRRLAKASLDVHLGADWIDALWRRGVIRRSDAEVLASSASVGNLVWACRELADTAERRQQLRLQLLIQSLFPLAVVVMGLAVAILCVSYFLPLVTLIERLSDV